MLDETQSTLAAETERAQQEAERAQQEAERAQQEAERAEAALIGLRTTLRGVLESRGWTLEPEIEHRIDLCTDPVRLTDWIASALQVESESDLDIGKPRPQHT